MRYKLLNLGCGETVTVYLPGMVCERVKVRKITYDSVTVVDRNGRCLELDKGAIEGLEKHFTIWNIFKGISNLMLNISAIVFPVCLNVICVTMVLERTTAAPGAWNSCLALSFAAAILSLKGFESYIFLKMIVFRDVDVNIIRGFPS